MKKSIISLIIFSVILVSSIAAVVLVELSKDELIHYDEVLPTCELDGNLEYYYSKKYDKYYDAQKRETNIFIYPGYKFQFVDAMITNFHLPESTLIMLVSAFLGIEETLKIYKTAVEEEYRFFSFGDACLFI